MKKVTGKYNVGLMLLCCGLLSLCAGCDKDPADNKTQTAFEIDKPYERGPLAVHVLVEKAQITIADTVMLRFEATIEAGYEVQMPEVGGVMESFGILDWDNLGDKLDENNNVVKRYQYRLEPFLSGTFQIPAFGFQFHETGGDPEQEPYVLETEPIDVEVTSLLGEQREGLVIADIEDVVEMPKESMPRWLYVTGLVLIYVLPLVILAYFRRRKIAKVVRIFRSAHEIAYERLRKLVKEDLVTAGRIKEFYERVSDILRHYIEHRFDLRAPERTTEEFLIELADTDVLTASDKSDVGEFLKHCDLVKFAKHSPTTDQIQGMFDLVKSFIEKTKSDRRQVDVTGAVAKATQVQPIEVGGD
ncbi:MAG: hypothetical protein KAR47_01440 [Planctomycetes bacterium]|nr:hypothetical protein [Planctomycetota bacterium]